MADYLEAYARHFDLPVRSGTRVERVEPVDGGFVVSTPDGARIAARQVIVATGPFRGPTSRRSPASWTRRSGSCTRTSTATRRSSSDGPVLVVGLSHSGADIAFEVANAGHRTILSGKSHGQMPIRVTDTKRAMLGWPVVEFVFGHVFTMRTPIGRKMRPGGPQGRRPAPAGPPARPGPGRRRTPRRRGRSACATAGRCSPTAPSSTWPTSSGRPAIVPDYGFVAAPIVGEDGWPVEVRGVSPTVPGLYFLGVPFQYAFASMLVAGAGRDAKLRRRTDRRARRATSKRPVADGVGRLRVGPLGRQVALVGPT